MRPAKQTGCYLSRPGTGMWVQSIDSIADFNGYGYLCDSFYWKLGLMERAFLPSRPPEIRLDDASDRLLVPGPSWSPTLQNSSILRCLSELIARFPGYDNPQWTKDFSSDVCIVADLATGSA